MKAFRFPILAFVLFYLAGGCQAVLAPRVAVYGAVPDFPLLVASVLGMYATRRGATVLGFFAGLLQGLATGVSLAGYIVSRVLAGFILGCYNQLELEKSYTTAFLVGAALAVLAGIAKMFLDPPSQIAGYLTATIGTALYNGVLAALMFPSVRRFLHTTR